jgi:hypothetical protein
MHIKLKRIFDKLESDRINLLSELSSFSEDQLQQIPSPGKWSILYTLTHILTAERMSLIYMKKKSLGVNEVDNSGIVEELKFRFLQASQRLPMLKFKAPKAVVEHTPISISFATLKTQWEKSRQDLYAFLESIEEKNVRKKIYKHVIVGRLDAIQGVGFLREHFIHHLPRLKKQITAAKR